MGLAGVGVMSVRARVCVRVHVCVRACVCVCVYVAFHCDPRADALHSYILGHFILTNYLKQDDLFPKFHPKTRLF